jgi:hypothetical protein
VFEGVVLEATLDPVAKEWADLSEDDLKNLGEMIKDQVQACESAFMQLAA